MELERDNNEAKANKGLNGWNMVCFVRNHDPRMELPTWMVKLASSQRVKSQISCTIIISSFDSLK